MLCVVRLDAMFKKEVTVQSVCAGKPRKSRSVSIVGDNLMLRILFKTEVYGLQDILVIEGRSEATIGLEEECWISIAFENGRKLFFNGFDTSQQQFIDQLITKLAGRPIIEWGSGYVCPFPYNGQVFYRRR